MLELGVFMFDKCFNILLHSEVLNITSSYSFLNGVLFIFNVFWCFKVSYFISSLFLTSKSSFPVLYINMLGNQTYGVELGLVDPVSGLCDWVWYHVKCLGHDTSVRQHYKSEQTPSWYDWKTVESDVKPEQTTTTKHPASFQWLGVKPVFQHV